MPGTAVSGNVLLCTDDGADGGGGACAGGSGASGTVEGVVIDIRGLGGTVSLAPGSPSGVAEVIGSGSDQAAILVDSRADGTLAGWLGRPNGADPSSGTIYCLENGHATNLANHAVTFESIGRLGQCPGHPDRRAGHSVPMRIRRVASGNAALESRPRR